MVKITDMQICNYRGSLHIKSDEGKYYWAVECDLYDAESWDWKQIPEDLYNALKNYDDMQRY